MRERIPSIVAEGAVSAALRLKYQLQDTFAATTVAFPKVELTQVLKSKV